jgi:hypothetical protein
LGLNPYRVSRFQKWLCSLAPRTWTKIVGPARGRAPATFSIFSPHELRFP